MSLDTFFPIRYTKGSGIPPLVTAGGFLFIMASCTPDSNFGYRWDTKTLRGIVS